MSAAGRVRFAPIPLLLALFALGGCASPAYYAQAVSGHLELMRSRQDIGRYIEAAAPDDATAERLSTAQAMLRFAERELALPANGSYREFAPTPGDAVTWNVVATPPYSLAPRRWCFPVAGCVPYRGYFEREDAERFAAKMRRKGRDASVSGAGAYSTLGWFDDPILGTMLERSDADLADVLFHELAHQALYVKGDTDFNESYASFVGRQGVRAWMHATGDTEGLARWEAREDATRDFLALLGAARRQLRALYAAGGTEAELATGKREAFRDLRADYDRLVQEAWAGRDRFGGWFDPPPNNADLALVASYTGGLCAFETLWREAGEDFSRFHALARERGELPADTRTAWLATPCP